MYMCIIDADCRIFLPKCNASFRVSSFFRASITLAVIQKNPVSLPNHTVIMPRERLILIIFQWRLYLNLSNHAMKWGNCYHSGDYKLPYWEGASEVILQAYGSECPANIPVMQSTAIGQSWGHLCCLVVPPRVLEPLGLSGGLQARLNPTNHFKKSYCELAIANYCVLMFVFLCSYIDVLMFLCSYIEVDICRTRISSGDTSSDTPQYIIWKLLLGLH